LTTEFNGAMSLKQLAEKYKVSRFTMRRWINRISPEFKSRGRGLYTPKEIKQIVEHLGDWK